MLQLIFQIMQQNRSKKCNTRWYFELCFKKKLASLKNEVDKLDIDKSPSVSTDLS